MDKKALIFGNRSRRKIYIANEFIFGEKQA